MLPSLPWLNIFTKLTQSSEVFNGFTYWSVLNYQVPTAEKILVLLDQNIMMIDLIDELEQVVLRWVHAHRPHGPAELLGADVSTPVNVKLIERLQSRIYN